MKDKENSLSASKPGLQKNEGATPEDALEAITSYYENVSDAQFAEDVRNSCFDGKGGSIESPTSAEEEDKSDHQSSVLR